MRKKYVIVMVSEQAKSWGGIAIAYGCFEDKIQGSIHTRLSMLHRAVCDRVDSQSAK